MNLTQEIIDENELTRVLNKWFKSVQRNKYNFYTRNPVIKSIKENLKKWGHWKNLGKNKRGNLSSILLTKNKANKGNTFPLEPCKNLIIQEATKKTIKEAPKEVPKSINQEINQDNPQNDPLDF